MTRQRIILMALVFITLLTLILSCQLFPKSTTATTATTATTVPPNFPTSWEGVWEGELGIHKAGDTTHTIPMSLEISPKDTSWNFIITYNANTKHPDRRVYSLLVENDSMGHYIIDEHNSILLDAYVLDNCLYSEFAVMKTKVLSRICLEGEKMEYEMISSKTKPTRISGNSSSMSDSIPEAKSYLIANTTKAILKKKE